MYLEYISIFTVSIKYHLYLKTNVSYHHVHGWQVSTNILKEKKTYILLWYFVSKRRATKVSSTFKTNCTRISAGEWKCILPKKKISFDFQAKKNQYMM